MKANVFVYLTNGNVVRLYVQHPEVGYCNNGIHVGIFNHCCLRCAIDDYDEWYEDIAIYSPIEIACVYANDKCVWYNSAYINDNSSAKRVQEELYYESPDLNIEDDYIESMFDYDDQDSMYC